MVDIRKKQNKESKKRKSSGDNDDDHMKKIMALEAKLQEQAQVIAKLSSDVVPLPPPTTNKNPLKPPPGFTQRE